MQNILQGNEATLWGVVGSLMMI